MDLILFNGTIHTVNEKQPRVEAVAIKDGIIQAVGDNEAVLELKQPHTQMMDLDGKLVIPGFNDCHLHLLAHGINLERMDCRGIASIAELVEKGKQFIKERNLAPGQWVLGYGWDESFYAEKRLPTCEDLDRISTENPIALTRVCVHSVLVNSCAMALAEITSDSPQPDGGSFSTDDSGNPTGLFSETGRYLIYNRIPDPDLNEIKAIIRSVADIAVKLGITSIQSDDFEALNSKNWRDVVQAYTELRNDGELPLRVYQQCLLPDYDRLKAFIDEGYTTGVGDAFYKIGPLKLLTDGSIGSQTAYLREPYEDKPDDRGICVLSEEELDNLTELAQTHGMQLLYHAIGDASMIMCLDAFQKVYGQSGDEKTRPGIVHCQITDDALLKRFEEQKVMALVQPITLANDLQILDRRLGEDRVQRTYCYRSLVESGVNVGLSSDCPVDDLDPIKNVYVATTRQDFSGYPKAGWHPEECLSVEQAVYGLTMGGAICSFEESVKGSIETGKYADLVVLSEDIFSVASRDLLNVDVCLTLVDGKVVYEKENP